MTFDEKLAFLRRVTIERGVYVPPFTFGPHEVLYSLSEVQDCWLKSRDVSTSVGGTSLYVHVPFCRERRCTFCMYASSTQYARIDLIQYRDGIARTFDRWRNLLPDQLDGFYVGGGTPSIYAPGDMKRLLRPFCGLRYRENGERTCEMSPATATLRHVDAVAEMHVNRLSLGIQSFDRSVLRAVNRSFAGLGRVEGLCERARKLKFIDVNLDLMLGLPLITEENLRESVRKVVDSGALSSTVYYWRQTTEQRSRLAWEFGIVCEEMQRYGWTLVSGTSDTEHHLFHSPERLPNLFRQATNANCVDNRKVVGLGVHAHGFRSGFSYSCRADRAYDVWRMNEATQMRMAMANFLYFGKGRVNKSAFYRLFGCRIEDVFTDEIVALQNVGLLLDELSAIEIVGVDPIERCACQKMFWDWGYLVRTYGEFLP